MGGAEWDPVRPLLAPMDLSTDRRHAPPRSQGRTARSQTRELLRCQLPPSRSSKASPMTQKAQLISNITEAMVEVEGEGMRDLTWVVIEEVKKGDWAIGGTPISPKTQATTS